MGSQEKWGEKPRYFVYTNVIVMKVSVCQIKPTKATSVSRRGFSELPLKTSS